MPVDIDAAAILAGSIFVAILGASAVLWIVHLQRDQRKSACEAGVPAWPIGWINFGIFPLCIDHQCCRRSTIRGWIDSIEAPY